MPKYEVLSREIEEEIKKAKELCETLGIDLRVREYIA